MGTHSKMPGQWMYAIAIRAKLCCGVLDLRASSGTQDRQHIEYPLQRSKVGRGGRGGGGVNCCGGLDGRLTTDLGRGGESTQSKPQHQ